jgi:hypothetical protein
VSTTTAIAKITVNTAMDPRSAGRESVSIPAPGR